MLEHTHRDDAVVPPALLPIVQELEAQPVGDAALKGAATGHRMLLLGEGDSGDVDAELLAEEKPQAPPARADVEHALAGLEQHLGRDVPLLVELGLLERLIARLEIGAGILAVAVEEKVVKLVLEVVVMRHVALCGANRIVLLE